jgi:hypothetical protein
MFTRLNRRPCSSTTVDDAENASRIRSTVSLALALCAILLAVLPPAAGEAEQTYRPPVLKARGAALEWSVAGHHNQYRLLINAPGRRLLMTVFARSFSPPPVPGSRVVYRVKAAPNASPWSNRVEITYPPGGEKGPPHVKEEEPPPPPPGEEHGSAPHTAKYRIDASTYFGPFGGPVFAPWVRSHIALIKGYPPASDPYVSLFGLPVIGYHDPATEGQAPLEATGIATYLNEVRRDMRHAYAGVFIDDANWSPGARPSPGPKANLANLIEAIHAAEPRALIEINSHFFDIWQYLQSGDPDVTRALKYVALICQEFGVGPTSGINSPQKYAEFMHYVDLLHAKGIHLTLTADRFNNNIPTAEYNLATYFLFDDGGDYVNGERLTPLNWWSGFDVNLGAAAGPRELLPGGVWTRRFAGGLVYTVEPGAGTHTIALPRAMHSAMWGTVRSLTLSAGQGAVLTG